MEKDFGSRVRHALASVPLESSERPRIGLILGSGLGSLVERFQGRAVPYSAIAGFPRPTVEGHSGTLLSSGALAVMAGRFHFYEGFSMDEVVLPVFVLHGLGVRTLIVTNAAGGVRRYYRPGQLVLIRDHINLMGVNPLRGPNPPDLGPRFPDMTEAYSRRLRRIAQGRDHDLVEGVYAAFAGPTYETPAEVRMAEAVGADLVGMSTVPEVIAARYLGMEVLGLSMVTNMAAGIVDQPLSHREVVETAGRVIPRLGVLLAGVLEELGVPGAG
jgi:purine-nucleoside phosphorylase